ncbi:ribonuclease H-like domain-containing protein, partial [Tanacetum coccineum]
MSYLSKTAHSTVKRPIHKNTTFKNSNFNQRVNIVKDKNVNNVRPKAVVNAAKPKAVVNTARPKAVLNAVKGNQIQVSDGLGPQKKLIFLSNVQGNPQMDLQDQGVIDSGCSRHLIGNMSYHTDYEEIDGRYVTFGGNPKGGKITGRCIIKTGNLDFENVLTDESQVLLKVPRKNNMYSVDLKNIVPKGATKDETSGTLKSFITRVENLLDQRVKVIRCDNGTEFKNKEMNQFCERKGFMRPFGSPVTILNTIDYLGKFDGKVDKGFFVGYSIYSKAFRTADPPFSQILKSSPDAGFKTSSDDGNKVDEDSRNSEVNAVCGKISIELPDDPNMPPLEDIVYSDDDEDVSAEANMKNLDAFMPISPILTTTIEEEVYVCQSPGFEDLNFPNRVYKVGKALYGSIKALRAWYETLSTYLLDNEFQRGKIDKTLFIKIQRFTEVKTASTPIETQMPLLKDENGEEVDVHMYRYPNLYKCKKQIVVVNSTTEAEYVAASSCFNAAEKVNIVGYKLVLLDQKMRMEQYLQCIDYTLWEIIESGNAPIVTKTVDGKETVIPPTSVEE